MVLEVKNYNIRRPEELKELVEDYFKLEKNDNFYDLTYKDFKKIILNRQNFKFLFTKAFIISMDDFLFLIKDYYEERR